MHSIKAKFDTFDINKKLKITKAELKPKDNYENVLCSEKLNLAKRIISKYESGNITEQIDKLLKELS